MDIKHLFEWIDKTQDEYLNFLKEIVALESPTTDKKGVDAVGAYFIQKAKEHGWKTEVFQQKTAGNVVVITMNGESTEAPVCLSGHMDTVHPVGLFGDPCVRIDGDRMIGPGVCDCKGGCVNAFWVMDALSQMGYQKRPVMLLLQTDEETSSRESGGETIRYITERSKDAVAFFNMEPSLWDNGVILERKGIAKFEFRISGVSQHAGRCYDGASAIAEAANKILKLEQYKEKDGITCNCGTIQGGTVPNTVPDACSFSLDTRFATEEQYREVSAFVRQVAEETSIPQTYCEVKEIGYRPPMPKFENNYELLRASNRILQNAGLHELEAVVAFGGSDAAYVALAGIPVIDSIGPVGNLMHSPNEYIEIDKFPLPTKRIAAIIADI